MENGEKTNSLKIESEAGKTRIFINGEEIRYISAYELTQHGGEVMSLKLECRSMRIEVNCHR